METNYHNPINIGNTNEITMKELANTLLNILAYESQLVYYTLPSDDPTNRRPNITLANEILDWVPTITLTQGLLKTIEALK